MKIMNDKQETARKWLKSKSYFYKYLSSYTIILIVPFLTIVLLFWHSHKLVKEQIQIASNNTLNQFFERIDDVVKDAYDNCVTIANNQKCMEYPYYASQRPGKTAYETKEISEMLADCMREIYHDIFVYFPVDDHVVSGINSSQKSDAYFDVYYDEKGNDFREEFRKLIECNSGKPVICSMNGKGLDAYLCMAMRQRNTRNEDYSYTVIVVFDKNYISNIMQSVEANNQRGISVLHNSAKEAIFSTDEQFLSYNLDGRRNGESVFEKNINGEKYVLQVRDSEAINAYYTYAVPYDYYWEKLLSLCIICAIGACISVVIGILIAKEEAKRVYRPINLLMSNLQKLGAAAYDDSTNTEFEFIESLFNKEVKEKVDLNIAIRQGRLFKRDNFIYSLLNGKRESTLEDSNDIFDVNGICLCSDCFYVVVLGIDQEGLVENDMRSFVLSNVFCELLNEDNQGYMVALPADRYAILINVQKDTEKEYLLALLDEGKVFLKQYYKIGMTLGVSLKHEGMPGIHVAYEEACLAFRYKYLLGEECIIDYQQIGGRSFEYIPVSEAKLLFKVSDYLFGDSQQISAQKLVDEVMADYKIDREASIETVECFKFETISTLNRVMTQGGYWAEGWKDMTQDLLESTTLQKFKERFTVLLAKLYEKQQEKVGRKDVCAEAFEYIEAHYSESQLSLNFLGELLDVSPSYLSKLFKEKYKISIPDFITLSRINGAKLQLRSTKHSIGKVAEDNGFLSSSVFIKSFKKMEGITPGIYRGFYENKK